MSIRINSIKVSPSLGIEYLPGIGRHTPRALHMYGIDTIKQFALFTDNEAIALLGATGKKLLKTAKQIAKLPA